MEYELGDKEYESIQKKSNNERYEYMVKKIADFEEIWTLYEEGKVFSLGDSEGKNYIPFWPHKRFALDYSRNDSNKVVPYSIEIHEFINIWLPNMKKDDVFIASFPMIGISTSTLCIDEFKRDIVNELSKME